MKDRRYLIGVFAYHRTERRGAKGPSVKFAGNPAHWCDIVQGKMRIQLWGVAVLVAAQASLLPRIYASPCDNSERSVGAFGAEGTPANSVALDPAIRSQLSGLNTVRRIIDTTLSPSGEKIVIFESGTDDYDPHPTVAIVVRNRVLKIFDERLLNLHAGGFERYLASCEFSLTQNRRALAVAVSAGGDGAGSAFAIIGWRAGAYQILFDPMVAQGRMQLGAGKLKLWSSIWGKAAKSTDEPWMDFECEWCPHRYAISEYRWRDGTYVKTTTRHTRKKYDPATITGTSLIVDKPS